MYSLHTPAEASAPDLVATRPSHATLERDPNQFNGAPQALEAR